MGEIDGRGENGAVVCDEVEGRKRCVGPLRKRLASGTSRRIAVGSSRTIGRRRILLVAKFSTNWKKRSRKREGRLETLLGAVKTPNAPSQTLNVATGRFLTGNKRRTSPVKTRSASQAKTLDGADDSGGRALFERFSRREGAARDFASKINPFS